MYTSIQKWGNSSAVRLPKAAMEKAGLQQHDRVEILVQEGSLLITPARRHLTLRERAAGYSGEYRPEEWQTGEIVGKEAW